MGVAAQVRRNSPVFEPVSIEASLHDKVDMKNKKKCVMHGMSFAKVLTKVFPQHVEWCWELSKVGFPFPPPHF